MAQQTFSEDEINGVYRAVYERRDIRKHFLPTPITQAMLRKLLNAAHHAGSVGFMQPWNFIVIQDQGTKSAVKKIFEEVNEKARTNYSGQKRQKYASLKLEGIEEAPVNLCVTCDPQRGGPHVLGRSTVRETDIYSTCCAIQNLWLVARAEGIGVGWVSILDNHALQRVLQIPPQIIPIAYLCMGYVAQFPDQPMLEEEGWAQRLPLEDVVHEDRWGGDRLFAECAIK